ncbi:MAG: N-acyl homoserine lactonase family protein [Solirubrobacterales bacterium]
MTSELRLYLFRCGDLEIRGRPGGDYSIPVQWYLITHPRGHVVIDGGNPVEVCEDPVARWGEVAHAAWPTMTRADGCLAQLERLGLDPGEVRHVIQSHLHMDHTGAVAAIDRLPAASVLITREEYGYALAPDWFYRRNYFSADFAKPGVRWDFLEAGEDGWDLFGDGAVTIWRTPGHSPGHVSVEVRLPNTGSVLLTIDAAHTVDQWEERALSPVATSNSEVARSIRKLHRIAERSRSLVVFGHDGERLASLKQAPDYYD